MIRRAQAFMKIWPRVLRERDRELDRRAYLSVYELWAV